MTARALRWLFLLLYAWLLLRTAWLCDDAYISFRTVRNFVAGDGLCWNLGERVQVFTHPLWLFLVSGAYAVTHEIYFTTLALSAALSLGAAVWLAWRVAPTPATGALGVALLAASRSYVDYSTSGMENALTHLLLVVLLGEILRPGGRLLRASLLCGLLAANRLDTLLVTAPLLVFAFRRAPRGGRLARIALGLSPVIAWQAFAVFYFGFPFPNTALAKLAPGLPWIGRLVRGGATLATSIAWDPLLAIAGIAGLVLALRRRSPLAGGIVLQCLYILWMGGDFMAGRFLTVPFLLGVVALIHGRLWSDRQALLAAAAATLLGLLPGARASLLAGPSYGSGGRFWPNILYTIADERGVYYKITGLLREGEAWSEPRHKRFDLGTDMKPGEVVPAVTIGFTGWAAPRDTLIIDRLALADPLLARLPPRDTKLWRAGHVEREIPSGYLETRRSGRIKLADPAVADLYRKLVLVTQGPLLGPGRFRAILELNFRR